MQNAKPVKMPRDIPTHYLVSLCSTGFYQISFVALKLIGQHSKGKQLALSQSLHRISGRSKEQDFANSDICIDMMSVVKASYIVPLTAQAGTHHLHC